MPLFNHQTAMHSTTEFDLKPPKLPMLHSDSEEDFVKSCFWLYFLLPFLLAVVFFFFLFWLGGLKRRIIHV